MTHEEITRLTNAVWLDLKALRKDKAGINPKSALYLRLTVKEKTLEKEISRLEKLK